MTEFDRLTRLVKGVTSEASLAEVTRVRDVAAANLRATVAEVSQATAHLRSARRTLDYAKIFFPSMAWSERAIDPGQTVASSFPRRRSLVIAEDLRKMQVLADIDEADVGKSREEWNRR